MLKKILLYSVFISFFIKADTPFDSHRYAAMLPFLQQFKRPITVGIIDDMYTTACTLAVKHKAVPILITPDCNNKILATCIALKSPILLIKKQPSLDELVIVGDCEHFDIVCAFSLIEQYGYLWQRALNRITKWGDYTLIETTLPEHEHYLEKYERTLLAAYENKSLWLIHEEKKYLTRRSWFYVAPSSKMYQVKSTFTEKQFIKDKGTVSKTPWIPGINLQTFKELNGVYPTHSMIRDQIKGLKSIAHNDMAIFNIVIQNGRLAPIDGNEHGRTRWLRFALWSVLKEFKG